MESIALHIVSTDAEVRTHREEIAKRVREYFCSRYVVPSNARTLCYLDDRDLAWIKENWGGSTSRGIHWPIRGQGLAEWPQDMWYTIAPADPISGQITWPYDSVIYLHGSTCKIDIQLTMTLAHELQHFLQFVNDRQMWAINALITQLPCLPADDLKRWFDIPTEKEARITSKRVAEHIYGSLAVERHIAKMIETGLSNGDIADWEFVRSIDSSADFDLRLATVPLVRKYRRELEELKLRTFSEDKDLGSVSLNIGDLAWELA